MNPPKRSNEKAVIEGKVFAILSYLSVLCIIPLILKKDNPFVLHHGKQGLVIFVGEVGVFVLQVLLGSGFSRLFMFVLGVYSFVGIIQVLRGEYVKLWGVYDLSEKITL